jgi:osmotically inducible lipoprotein OsmB
VDIMKTRLWIAAAAATSVMAIAGCASGPNQNLGTGVGAVGGALVGNAIGGNTAARWVARPSAASSAIRSAAMPTSATTTSQRYPQGSNYYPSNGPQLLSGFQRLAE